MELDGRRTPARDDGETKERDTIRGAAHATLRDARAERRVCCLGAFACVRLPRIGKAHKASSVFPTLSNFERRGPPPLVCALCSGYWVWVWGQGSGVWRRDVPTATPVPRLRPVQRRSHRVGLVAGAVRVPRSCPASWLRLPRVRGRASKTRSYIMKSSNTGRPFPQRQVYRKSCQTCACGLPRARRTD